MYFRDILGFLRQHVFMLVLFPAIGMLVGVCIYKFTPKTYSGSVNVLFDDVIDQNSPVEDDEAVSSAIREIVAMSTSDTLKQALFANSFEGMADSSIKADSIPGTRVMTLSIDASDASNVERGLAGAVTVIEEIAKDYYGIQVVEQLGSIVGPNVISPGIIKFLGVGFLIGCALDCAICLIIVVWSPKLWNEDQLVKRGLPVIGALSYDSHDHGSLDELSTLTQLYLERLVRNKANKEVGICSIGESATFDPFFQGIERSISSGDKSTSSISISDESDPEQSTGGLILRRLSKIPPFEGLIKTTKGTLQFVFVCVRGRTRISDIAATINLSDALGLEIVGWVLLAE